AVGDVSGDGKPDIVTANQGGGSLSVLLGNGNGTFQAKLDQVTGGSPVSVAIGDLNGDGKGDLVTANGAATIALLLSNGNGAFQQKVDVGTGVGPNSVTIGDVNGDGNMDIVTANSSGAEKAVWVVLGRGDGTFVERVDYATAGSTVSVLPGLGLGAFGPKQDHRVATNPASVGIADLNGDSKLDLVVSHINASPVNGTLAVLLGAGSGTFFAPMYYNVGDKPYSLAVGDITRDGKADIVTANYDDNNVAFLINNGDGSGTFQPAVYYPTGTNTRSVELADLSGSGSGSGRMDLVVANSGGNTVSVLEVIGDAFLPRVD